MPSPLLSFISGMVNGSGPDGGKPTAGQSFANGLAAASEGYDQFIQQQNQLQNAGKAADYARKALGDDAEQMTGITDEEWGNLGSKDRAAAMTGLQQKNLINQMLSQTQMMQNRGDLYQSEADQQGADASADQRFSQSYRQATQPQMQPGGPDMSGSPLLTRIMGAKAPALANPNGSDLLNLMLRSGVRPEVAIPRAVQMSRLFGGQGNPENFFPSDPTQMAQDVPGFPDLKRIITGPKSSILRDQSGNVATPMTDEDGNAIGYGVSNGNGTVKFVPKSATEDKGAVTDAERFKAGAAMHAQRVKEAAGPLQMMTPGTDEYKAQLDKYNGALQDQEDFLGGKAATSGAGKQLSQDQAVQYLRAAGGDMSKARAAAKKDGYSF